MDVVIVAHTEPGFFQKGECVFEKAAKEGVIEGSINLANLAELHGALVTFAVMPEVSHLFPKKLLQMHELGLHIHPGWEKAKRKDVAWIVGDTYLRKHCFQSSCSTALRDYSFAEQMIMIQEGKRHISEVLQKEPKIFVAGRWSVNNDTVKVLSELGFSHDCSAAAHQRADHYDWSRLNRIHMPYYPSQDDYQKSGDTPLLIVPISQYLPWGNVNPEATPKVGLSWLKAAFSEYYDRGVPFFHICLHSPSMTDSNICASMSEFLRFIASHKGVRFSKVSEISKYSDTQYRASVLPYFFAANTKILKSGLKKLYGAVR